MKDKKAIKIVFVGESGVGKTNLIRISNDEPFQKERDCTLSSSFLEKDIIVNNKQYSYNLWDTAGQEIYRSLNKIYLKNSKIVFVVFALNDKKSYQEVDFWINSTKEALEEGKYIMALIGNKSDLYNEQEVSDKEVKKKADELKIDFKLTSAVEDAVGFRQFLEDLIKKFINNIGFNPEEDEEKSFNLNEEKKNEENNVVNAVELNKKKKCC